MDNHEGLGYMSVSKNEGYLFGGPHSEDYTVLGTAGPVLGSPRLWKPPYVIQQHCKSSQAQPETLNP